MKRKVSNRFFVNPFFQKVIYLGPMTTREIPTVGPEEKPLARAPRKLLINTLFVEFIVESTLLKTVHNYSGVGE